MLAQELKSLFFYANDLKVESCFCEEGLGLSLPLFKGFTRICHSPNEGLLLEVKLLDLKYRADYHIKITRQII
jgi:hypothetical protein